jgi:hypothetical protein
MFLIMGKQKRKDVVSKDINGEQIKAAIENL